MARVTSKYHAKRIVVDGERFDSKSEYKRWCELKLLVEANIISNLKRQVPFLLIPAQRENGKVIERAVTYKADFVYEENGETVVEDRKGVRTPDYIIKRKLMLWVYGIKVKETK